MLSDVPEVSVKEPVAAAASNRPRVVILGSGWASMSMIKALPENIRCAAAAAAAVARVLQIAGRTPAGSSRGHSIHQLYLQYRVAFWAKIAHQQFDS